MVALMLAGGLLLVGPVAAYSSMFGSLAAYIPSLLFALLVVQVANLQVGIGLVVLHEIGQTQGGGEGEGCHQDRRQRDIPQSLLLCGLPGLKDGEGGEQDEDGDQDFSVAINDVHEDQHSSRRQEEEDQQEVSGSCFRFSE